MSSSRSPFYSLVVYALIALGVGISISPAVQGEPRDVASTATSDEPLASEDAASDAAASDAAASDAAAERSGDGVETFSDEISVTGQQQTRTLQETTASVVVVTAADLAEGTSTDLYDVVAATPNVQAAQGFRGFSIRGIDQRGFGSGTGLLVNVEVDGVSLHNDASTYFGPYSMWDMEQVEIFRGPQSTQKGRNALAGAVVLRSAAPTYERQAATRLSYGSLETWQAAAMVNLPLVDNKVALRLSVDQQRSDGWVENPTRGEDDYDFRDVLTVRGKLRFDPTERFRGLLSFTYSDHRRGEDIISPLQFPASRLNFSNEEGEEGSEHQLVALELSYRLSERWRLESLSSFLQHDYLRIEDTDQSPFGDNNRLDQTADDRSVSQQLRLVYEGKGRTQGVLGLYYADLEDDSLSAATLPGTFFGLPAFVSITGFLDRQESTENSALFGEVDWQLSEHWTLTAGARFDQEERRTVSAQTFTLDPPVVAFPALPPEDLPSDYDAFLPKVALTYRADDSWMVGGSVQRGYRAGGRSIAFISQQVNDFDPEVTDNYELFLRSRQGDRWQFNATAFYVDWQDQQVSVRTALGISNDVLTVNAGTSQLSGVEAELRFRPRRNLELSAAAGWLKTEFEEFVDGGADFSGNEFPFAPRWSANLGMHWTITSHWDADIRVSARDGFFSDASNGAQFEVDSRTLVDVKVGYRQPGWAVHLFARNLFDEDYFLHLVPEGGRAGEPQVVGLSWTLDL